MLIFPSKRLEPDTATLHRSLLDGPQVQRIYLDELPLNQQPVGIALMQLMIEREEQTIEQAKQLIARVNQEEVGNLSKEEIINIVATIAVYKFTNLSREEVEAMLGLTIEQTRVYQEAKAEGRQEMMVQLLSTTVPLLLQAGMTVEQIAQHVGVDVEVVRQVAQQQS